jgi:hypothetical protein
MEASGGGPPHGADGHDTIVGSRIRRRIALLEFIADGRDDYDSLTLKPVEQDPVGAGES